MKLAWRAVVLLGVVVAVGATSVSSQAHSTWPPKDAFRVAGSATGLFPGGQRPLILTVTNLTNAKIRVERIQVVSVRSSRPGCSPTVVWSPGFKGSLPIAKTKSAKVTVPIHMRASAPTTCQGVTFTLSYQGIGVRP